MASDARLVDAYLLCYISMFILYLSMAAGTGIPDSGVLRISKLIEELTRLALALKTVLRQPRWEKV